jgi:hypothetical protein
MIGSIELAVRAFNLETALAYKYVLPGALPFICFIFKYISTTAVFLAASVLYIIADNTMIGITSF